MQFAVSDTPMTLKQSQSHETQNDNVDPKQIHNYVKFQSSLYNGIREKADVRGFSNEEKCQLSSLNMYLKQKQWYIRDLLDVINDRSKF